MRNIFQKLTGAESDDIAHREVGSNSMLKYSVNNLLTTIYEVANVSRRCTDRINSRSMKA